MFFTRHQLAQRCHAQRLIACSPRAVATAARDGGGFFIRGVHEKNFAHRPTGKPTGNSIAFI